jgi:hypothetical protein
LGTHHKIIIRRIHSDLRRRPRRRERGPKYAPDVEALPVTWETCDHICAGRMTPDLAWMAEHLAYDGELQTTPELLARPEETSIPAIRRILRRISQHHPCARRRRPEERPLTKGVPVRRIPGKEKQPGHL